MSGPGHERGRCGVRGSKFATPVRWATRLIAAVLALMPPVSLGSSDADAKRPGARHCYKSVCVRVRTIDETEQLVGQTLLITTSHYGDPRYDRYNRNTFTSNGERFRAGDGTRTASADFPDGTELLLRNPLNGKVSHVRVNDFGPFMGNRRLDVTEQVARDLGFLHRGVIDLEVTVLAAPTIEDLAFPYRRDRRSAETAGFMGIYSEVAVTALAQRMITEKRATHIKPDRSVIAMVRAIKPPRRHPLADNIAIRLSAIPAPRPAPHRLSIAEPRPVLAQAGFETGFITDTGFVPDLDASVLSTAPRKATAEAYDSPGSANGVITHDGAPADAASSRSGHSLALRIITAQAVTKPRLPLLQDRLFADFSPSATTAPPATTTETTASGDHAQDRTTAPGRGGGVAMAKVVATQPRGTRSENVQSADITAEVVSSRPALGARDDITTMATVLSPVTANADVGEPPAGTSEGAPTVTDSSNQPSTLFRIGLGIVALILTTAGLAFLVGLPFPVRASRAGSAADAVPQAPALAIEPTVGPDNQGPANPLLPTDSVVVELFPDRRPALEPTAGQSPDTAMPVDVDAHLAVTSHSTVTETSPSDIPQPTPGMVSGMLQQCAAMSARSVAAAATALSVVASALRTTPEQKPAEQTEAWTVTPGIEIPKRMPSSPLDTVIGDGVIVESDIVSDGVVVIKGAVEGSISGRRVEMAETAVVAGHIAADEAIVAGQHYGNVDASELRVAATATVCGHARLELLSVEPGARVDVAFTFMPKRQDEDSSHELQGPDADATPACQDEPAHDESALSVARLAG